MAKVKINPGLACVILVASLFAGWECLLLVTLLMFIFCEVDERIKDVATKVITFYIGLSLVSLGWNIIVSGIKAITDAITSIVTIINTYRDPLDDIISAAKIIAPVTNLMDIADSVVDLLLIIAKFGFIISVFTFKPEKSNPLSSKINEYVNKVLNYINGNTNVNNSQTSAPQQPANPEH